MKFRFSSLLQKNNVTSSSHPVPSEDTKSYFNCLNKKENGNVIQDRDCTTMPLKKSNTMVEKRNMVKNTKKQECNDILGSECPPFINFSSQTPSGEKITVSTSEGTSKRTVSLAETLNGSFEVIFTADDDQFLQLVEEMTNSSPHTPIQQNSQVGGIEKGGRGSMDHSHAVPVQVVAAKSKHLNSPVSTLGFESPTPRSLFGGSVAQRLDHIHKKVLQLQNENEAMRAINFRLFTHVKKLRTASSSEPLNSHPTAAAGAVNTTGTATSNTSRTVLSPSSSRTDVSPTLPTHDLNETIIKQQAETIRKQESELAKQNERFEKMQVKLEEKRKTCRKLMMEQTIESRNSDPTGLSRPATTLASMSSTTSATLQRLRVEKEMDVLTLEVKCLQRELSSTLDQLDKVLVQQKEDKRLIESLREQLEDKTNVIQKLNDDLVLEKTAREELEKELRNLQEQLQQQKHEVEQDQQEEEKQEAQEYQNRLDSNAVIEQDNNDKNDDEEESVIDDQEEYDSNMENVNDNDMFFSPISEDKNEMSKIDRATQSNIRKLEIQLFRAQRQIREQQRELHVLATSKGISEFMKIWRTEKEIFEQRIIELELEVQKKRSKGSRAGSAFYSAEESSIATDDSPSLGSLLSFDDSEKSPQPVSPASCIITPSSTWPPIPTELLQPSSRTNQISEQ